MDLEKIVGKLRIILDLSDNSKDPLLEIIIEDVFEYLRSLGIEEPKESLVRRLVVLRYNALGSEGLVSEEYNGIVQSFLEDLPADIKRELKSLRAVKF